MDVFHSFNLWLSGWPSLVEGLLAQIGLPLDTYRLPWTLLQLGLLLSAFLVAVIASRVTTPIFENWIRGRKFRAGTLRGFAVVLRRLQIVYFAALLWLAVIVMRTVTWNSRSYFITLAASLVAAFALISIASRIIRNRSIARLVEWIGWITVTLTLLGLLPETMALLNSMALNISSVRISVLTLMQGIVVLTGLIWFASTASRIVDQRLSTLEDFTPSMRVLAGKLVRFSLMVLAIILGLGAIGVDFTALTLISGAVGLGVGFGLQKVISNLVSGVILLMDKSIKPGDVITVGDTFGWITSLHARYASVTMRDGREILIPNEDLITQQVQNWSFQDPYVRLDIHFGVSYKSDPHLVKKIAAEAAAKHKRVLSRFPAVCHITGFGDSSIDFILRFYIGDPKNGLTNIRGDIFLLLWDTLKEHGIEIPFPQRDVMIKQVPPEASARKRQSRPSPAD